MKTKYAEELLSSLKAGQHPVIRKQVYFKQTGIDEKNYIVRGVFSTGEEDRQGEIIDQTGWLLDEYKQNPVILFAHDPYQPAVAKCIEIDVVNGELVGAIQFASDEYEFAATLFKLYAGGYMRAFSVGFMNNKWEVDQENDVLYLKENVLYEISCVNVPANAGALASAKAKGIDTSVLDVLEKEKAVVPYADHGMASEDTAWDGPEQMGMCGDDMAKMKTICAWYDAENPDVKSSYKLPHHMASNLEANWKGVAAAMAALLGARGGVDIPEGDRQGVYNHLAKHYKQFEKEPPEFKQYLPEQLKHIEEYGTVLKVFGHEVVIREDLPAGTLLMIKTAADTLTGVIAAAEKTKGPIPPTRREKTVNAINCAVRQLLKARAQIKK